jgi:hypothetical protein
MLLANDGRSCAWVASQNGHTEALDVLLQAGGTEQLMIVNSKGQSCLMFALRQGHQAMVGFLLERGGPELVLILSASGLSCLHCAAADGDKKAGSAVAEMLVTAGGMELLEQADSRLGWTPLHNAVYAGNSVLVGRISAWMGKACDLEEVRRSVEALQEANIAIFRGMPQMAPVDSREGVVEFFEFSTVRSSKGCRAGCRCYYEVTILRVEECPQIGFAKSGFARVRKKTGKGVGDDDQSWGVDGARQLLWPSGDGGKYEVTWKAHPLPTESRAGLPLWQLRAEQELFVVRGFFGVEGGGSGYFADCVEIGCRPWQEGDVVGLACDLKKVSLPTQSGT